VLKADVVMLQLVVTIEHGGDDTVLLSMTCDLLLREYNTCGKKYYKLYTVLSYLGVVYLLYMLYFKISCVYCC